MSHSSAVLHWYRLGQISQEAAEELLRPYLRADLREKGVGIVLPKTYAEEDSESHAQVIDIASRRSVRG